jgi:hypothetical protein
MKDRRPLDLDAVLAGWPAGATPPRGFADRVLAACDGPARAAARPRRDTGSRWWYAAVAAAIVLFPLYVLHRSESNAAPPSVASIVASDLGDLGTQRD